MAYRYTADEAFEASEVGEPILIGVRDAAYMCRLHGAALVDFICEEEGRGAFAIDAAHVLAWLGY